MAASGNCDEEVDKQVEDNRSDDGGESSDDDDGELFVLCLFCHRHGDGDRFHIFVAC